MATLVEGIQVANLVVCMWLKLGVDKGISTRARVLCCLGGLIY